MTSNPTSSHSTANNIPEHIFNYKDNDLPYIWKQSLKDVEIQVNVPSGTRAKNLEIKIQPKFLKVGFKGEPSLFEGELTEKCKVEESTWTLENTNLLCIQLEKVNQLQWWDSVLINHPKIDTKKIQPENSKLSDLDGEARAMVEKMLTDKGQKSLLPPESEILDAEEDEKEKKKLA